MTIQVRNLLLHAGHSDGVRFCNVHTRTRTHYVRIQNGRLRRRTIKK